MVEVQDSKDETVEEKQSDTNEYAEKYIRRRGLDTSKPFTSRISKIGYDESGDLFARIRTPDMDFAVRIDGDRSDEENLAEFLSEAPRDLISKDRVVKTERKFDSWISDDLRRFGFNQDNKKYDLIIKDLPELSDQSEDLIEKAYPHYIYKKQSGDKPGVMRRIDQVDGLSDEKFKIELELTEDRNLEWIFSVPFQVDIDKHPLANLIENEANGDPRNLRSKSVFVVKKTDLIGRIHPIGFDTTEEWALVSKEEYRSWDPDMYNKFANGGSSLNSQSLQKLYLRYLIFLMMIMLVASTTFAIQILF